ncbi:MAG: MotA/TolQ/ExbB proton channel family protein [Planctomycetota bacterium]
MKFLNNRLATLLALFMFVAMPVMAWAQEAEEAPATEAPVRSAFDLIKDGGFIGVFTIIVGFAGMVLMVFLMLYHSKDKLVPEGLKAQLDQLLENGEYEDALQLCSVDESYLAKAMAPAIRDVELGYDSMMSSANASIDNIATLEHQVVTWLSVVQASAPMLGLFGTVSGMIDTFALIATLGAPSASDMAGGIQEALATTYIGLFVAIPFLFIYAVFRDNTDKMIMKLTADVEDLLLRFRGGNA